MPSRHGNDAGRSMHSDDQSELRLLLDEHYPGWLADELTAEGIALVPDHVGVIYCHHTRFPRTRPGLNRLRKAISALAADPPPGLGKQPVVWWLAQP